MMYKRPYFDACLFVAWIMDEIKEGERRGEIVDHLFELARKKIFRIFSSTLNLAEVHKTDGSDKLHGHDDDFILAMFENEFFLLVEVDRNIGEEANHLCREYSLDPCDAIHLASALRAKCDVLLTWDHKLLRVNHPDIRVEKPVMIGQLELDLLRKT